jgi:putative transposase
MVAQEWEIGRSTVYAARDRDRRKEPLDKRGPRTQYTDAALTALIAADLAASPFVGEGHRKVWARLRMAGTRTSKTRVLRLMIEAELLAPS